MANIYDSTAERLHAYYPFEQDVTDRVANVAALQSRMAFGEFLNYFGIPAPEILISDGEKAIKVLDIIPKGDFDETKARVMHLAMGNDLDKNQIYQIATTFAADPSIRTIAFANPGGPRQKAGVLSVRDSLQVARGNPRPLIDRQLTYVAKKKIVKN